MTWPGWGSQVKVPEPELPAADVDHDDEFGAGIANVQEPASPSVAFTCI
jgi:hypothetical protein